MQIRFPKLVVKAWDRFGDWANETTFGIRRIDIILATMLVLGAGWYFFTGGWLMALQFAVLFAFIIICCLWLF